MTPVSTTSHLRIVAVGPTRTATIESAPAGPDVAGYPYSSAAKPSQSWSGPPNDAVHQLAFSGALSPFPLRRV